MADIEIQKIQNMKLVDKAKNQNSYYIHIIFNFLYESVSETIIKEF